MQDKRFVFAQAVNPHSQDSFVYGKVNPNNTFEISRFGYPKKRQVVSTFYGKLKPFSTGTKIEGHFDIPRPTKTSGLLFKALIIAGLAAMLFSQLQAPIANLWNIVAIGLILALAIWLGRLRPPQNRYDEQYLLNFLADTIQAQPLSLED